jgi:hypothetical protein
MPVSDESREGGHLPEKVLEEIFQQVIVETLDHPGLPVRRDDPEVALVVAQTGAGTRAAHAQLNDEFWRQGGVVSVITDDFRAYHPDYEWLRALYPEALREQTEQAARWWQDRAIEHLVLEGENIAFEDRFASPDIALHTAEVLQGVGYKVRVAAMVAPAAISRLGIIESYARSAGVAGAGPWISAEDHDASYATVVELVDRAEKSPAVSRITLHTQDGVLHDRRRDPAGRWEPGSRSSVDVLIDARNEPLSRLQRTALANRLAQTLEQMAEAGIGHRATFEMGSQVIEELAGHPLTLDGRTVARLNTSMAGLVQADAGTGPRGPLDAAIGDINAANQFLDYLGRLDPGPDPEQPPPEPPGPDLGSGL